MSGADAGLKTALRHNNIASAADLVALGEKAARRLPMVGPKVWAEAKRQASKRGGARGGARVGAGRTAADGATGLVQIAFRVTEPQKAKVARLGGSVWVRRAIDDAEEI